MGRRREFDYDLADADADGLADGNSSADASVTLDGALTSGGTFTSADGMGRIIIITDLGADDQSGATYTITGTDANDQAISENLTGPGASATVASTKFYKTVSSITIASPAAGSTVDIGTRGTTLSARGKAYVLDHLSPEPAQVALDVTGTCNVDVLITFDSLMDSTTSIDNANWVADANLAGETTDQNATIPVGCTGVMLEVNTYSSGAEIQMMVTQPSY